MSLAHAPQLTAFETALRAHRLSSIMLSVCGGAVVLALAEGEETGSKVEEVVRVPQRTCRRESCSAATLPAVVPRMSRECARSPASVARHARPVRHGANQHVAHQRWACVHRRTRAPARSRAGGVLQCLLNMCRVCASLCQPLEARESACGSSGHFAAFSAAPTRPRGGHVALKRVFKALEYSFPSRTWGWAVVPVEKMMCQSI